MNESFWVLENKTMPLYFGVCNGRAHWAVGLENAVKFHNQHSGYIMLSILQELGYGTNHNVTEHMYMPAPPLPTEPPK